jgi:type I restriction enzyme M protein
MDSTTRRKIDALRDTLVGKLPVPTQQVEQITLALLYKFMDDLDKQNVELGGQRNFFTNGYKQYSWTSITDKAKSGAERVALYGEALEKIALNPKLPQLFRDIFSRAYLPFRDPQTLNLFLQQIDDFTYEHSEDLGDAFEYLLSVMGSQGDAGQFRTPRHIIDFIVQAVDPDLDMRILDPACGTAGFLISAYKHIMMKYADDKGKPGAKLTPAQKKKLAQQFTGYDISHDMVRLSLVNMYLHNLPEPKIYEYDALTSEDKWGERAECILANPPFMSPKGGIRPHKKFAINATRSEVLFADYMLEHLTTGGRAGFIVPEGIIFQSGTAYKQLRKMLVDDGYLWAVVSLPAGVFQPYSGVKTSILLIDRNLAKQNENILFLKIENDGYDLGA